MIVSDGNRISSCTKFRQIKDRKEHRPTHRCHNNHKRNKTTQKNHSHPEKRKWMEDQICYGCNKKGQGHLASQCPKTKCFTCGKYGHVGVNCPNGVKSQPNYAETIKISNASYTASSYESGNCISELAFDSGASDHFFCLRYVLSKAQVSYLIT